MRYLWFRLLAHNRLKINVNLCGSNPHRRKKSVIRENVPLFWLNVLHYWITALTNVSAPKHAGQNVLLVAVSFLDFFIFNKNCGLPVAHPNIHNIECKALLADFPGLCVTIPPPCFPIASVLQSHWLKVFAPVGSCGCNTFQSAGFGLPDRSRYQSCSISLGSLWCIAAPIGLLLCSFCPLLHMLWYSFTLRFCLGYQNLVFLWKVWDSEYSHPNHKQGIRGLTPGMETFALVVRFSSTPMFINMVRPWFSHSPACHPDLP